MTLHGAAEGSRPQSAIPADVAANVRIIGGMEIELIYIIAKIEIMKTENSSDPRVHTANIKGKFADLIDHLRADIPKIEDPKAKALFEVSAEVITGLQKAFSDYEKKNEPAWQK